jgi:hypothetical protein
VFIIVVAVLFYSTMYACNEIYEYMHTDSGLRILRPGLGQPSQISDSEKNVRESTNGPTMKEAMQPVHYGDRNRMNHFTSASTTL